MDDQRPTLEAILALWPVADNTSLHLGVADLISLARASVSTRLSLHGFRNDPQLPQTSATGNSTTDPPPREFLNIGLHDTLYWRRLKDNAAFECSSVTHVRGENIHPCKYCSRPICEACIVRDSWIRGKGKENTFVNRCRSYCSKCWESGNLSKSRRFQLASSEDYSSDHVCTCTNKKDSWLCVPCKNIQNAEALSEKSKYCHGEGCTDRVGEHADRRRICMWCQKSLPSHLGSSFRIEWNLKMIEARRRSALSRQADIEEYNRRRLKQTRMSRRELRGFHAVANDPDADVPQYVRHLDTFNYRRHMPEKAAPTGNEVYLSKKGRWTYSRNFFKHFGRFCEQLPARPDLAFATNPDHLPFARTNLQRTLERRRYGGIQREWLEKFDTTIGRDRLEEWHNHKPAIQRMFMLESLSLDKVQFFMFQEHDFSGTEQDYRFIMFQWGSGWLDLRKPKPDDVEDDLDTETAESDLKLAVRLQEESDREAAQALQHRMWDMMSEASEDQGQDEIAPENESPLKDDNPIADDDEREPHILGSHIRTNPPNSSSGHDMTDPPADARMRTTHGHLSSDLDLRTASSPAPLRPVDYGDRVPADQEPQSQSSTTTHPVHVDDPPSYATALIQNSSIDSNAEDTSRSSS